MDASEPQPAESFADDTAIDISPDDAPAPTPRRVGSVVAAVVAGAVVIAAVATTLTAVLSAVFDAPPSAARAGSEVSSAPESPSVEPSPDAEPTPTPSPTLSSDPVEVSPSPRPGTPCDPKPRVEVTFGTNDGDAALFRLVSTRSGEPVCAGAAVRVLWVSYHYVNDGEQALYGGASFDVPTHSSQFTPTIDVHSDCPGDLYFVAGSGFDYIQQLAPGVHHPYPIASAANGWRGEIGSAITDVLPECLDP